VSSVYSVYYANRNNASKMFGTDGGSIQSSHLRMQAISKRNPAVPMHSTGIVMFQSSAGQIFFTVFNISKKNII